MKSRLQSGIRRTLFSAGVTAAAVAAAQPQTEVGDEISEVIIVTGSYISGTAEGAALPVEVISAEELEKQGTPTTLEMIKSLTVANGIIGESNQFSVAGGQAAEGSANINLRGLGATRTLLLLNGKRLATGDANLLPTNAIGRVEVLKDGGAATYGSDAVGGVVNFITKRSTDGLDLSADYRYIEDSDGDYTVGLAWGNSTDTSDLFISANYFHRSQLSVRDRDWALQPYTRNPQGGWSTGANPGAIKFGFSPSSVGSLLGPQLADPGCEDFGGIVLNVPASGPFPAGTQCQTRYTEWDNLVEKQDSQQVFSSYDLDLNETLQLHLEGLYAHTDVPHANVTPSYTTTRRITSTVAGYNSGPFASTDNDPDQTNWFLVPAANPGFQTFREQNPGMFATTPTMAFIQLNQYRPFFAGGNPAFGYGESFTTRERRQMRLGAELRGQIGNVGWTTSATYGQSKVTRQEWDIPTGKLALALRGLGGEGCNQGLGTPDFTEGTPGEGNCVWLNPFSNAVPGNPLSGYVNPNFVAANENTAALADWLQDRHRTDITTDLIEFDVVLDGELGWALPGGDIGWAAGGQYRINALKQTYNQNASTVTNPCPDTPINGATDCVPLPESPYVFLATYNPIDVDRDVYAVFGELNIPVLDSLNLQLAARFEDYGNQGGSSFDPKLSARWQIIEAVALRGSVGTTFRVSPQTFLIPDERIAFANVLGSNRPVGTTGNANLEPEEAKNYNFGVLLNAAGFRASVDYWRFDLDKLLTTEPRQGVIDILFPNGTTGPDNCATLDPAFIAAHFDFSGACAANNVTKLKLLSINGAGLVTDGIDVTVDYTFDEVLAGRLTLGASSTWIHKYESDTLIVNGVVFEQGYDAVGLFNNGLTAAPLPEWRAQGFLDFRLGATNVRWTTEFIDQYRDQRASIFTAASPDGQVIDSNITHDVTVRTALPAQTTLLVTVENVLDEDPSFARTEINYDALTGNPLGRTIKLGVRKQF